MCKQSSILDENRFAFFRSIRRRRIDLYFVDSDFFRDVRDGFLSVGRNHHVSHLSIPVEIFSFIDERHYLKVVSFAFFARSRGIPSVFLGRKILERPLLQCLGIGQIV
ncbi:hypothetical protein AR158_c170L [Paramecium bursaria Chlorella virus AR158]|uniref:hypothetical protein n=1 Tax=Paramecium bursaria Chlorella virus AR158 TaxID=380598 RepID=UPI00015AA822|nr:hypothetical protein AR158_c170L [Paramecium bursaria Chlorella virus AR158]ABU43716.1 hypothetical protein AR158_c170L [Paramecium bursaria Chlorella virus AR158]